MLPPPPPTSNLLYLWISNVPSISTIGLLPLIPAPGHEMATILTALKICNGVADKLLQTVVTFDQALYYKVKIVLWLYPELLPYFVIHLGVFDTAMNFLSLIGKYSHSGLSDI